MERIAGVALGGERFTIDRSTGTDFEGLFGVDSIVLVLGKNGAGKTTLLHGIADSVSLARNTKFQNVFVGGYDSIMAATPSYLRSCGVIYFSPLPYRRVLPKRVRLLDASPDFRGANNLDQIEQFHKVASDLEIETTLEAVIGYSNRFYRDVVIPVLVSSVAEFNDPELEKLVNSIKIYPSHIETKFESRSEFNSKDNESQVSQSTSELVRLIRMRADNYFQTPEDRILYMASIQMLSKNKNLASGLGRIFLRKIGLANFTSLKSESRAGPELERIINRTQSVFYSHDWQASKTDRNVLALEVKSADHARSLDPDNSAVQISWTKLSSGLRALVEQFASLRQAFEKFKKSKCRHVLLLIDEGDAYLHLDWQRKYVYMLDKFLSATKLEFEFDQLQVVLATHSPLIAADFPSALIDNLDGATSSVESFAAPIEEVIIGSFGAGTLGLFAESKINAILEKANNSNLSDSDFKVVDSIGDDGLRNAINRAIGRDSK